MLRKNGFFSKTIQCKYHGWTYNLNGQLVGAPNMENMDGFNKSDYPLNEIFIKEWEGFIFICMSDKAEYFDIFYKPIKIKSTPIERAKGGRIGFAHGSKRPKGGWTA